MDGDGLAAPLAAPAPRPVFLNVLVANPEKTYQDGLKSGRGHGTGGGHRDDEGYREFMKKVAQENREDWKDFRKYKTDKLRAEFYAFKDWKHRDECENKNGRAIHKAWSMPRLRP